MSILRELYYGNIGSHADMKASPQMTKACSKIVKAEEELFASLSEEQKKKYENVSQCVQELNAQELANTYENALSFGIGLGYESKIKIGELIK